MNREKNGKWPGISQEEGKFGNFHLIMLILKKKMQSPFLLFFSRKKQTIFLTFNNLQNISPNLYFLGGGRVQILKKSLI